MSLRDGVGGPLPILVEHFHPFMGKITKLHLCAFWPAREIATVSLVNRDESEDSDGMKLPEDD